MFLIKKYNRGFYYAWDERGRECLMFPNEDNIKKYGTLTCVLCWKPVEFADSSLEHLTPLSRGGSNDYENLGVAHRICNIKKGTKTLEEWNDRKPLTRKIKSDNISF